MSSAPALQAAIASNDFLRSIAHELRQPLSTIESIAYYLSLVSPREDQKVQEQLLRLQQLVEQSNWIIASGLQLTDSPKLSPRAVDFSDLIVQVIDGLPPLLDFLPEADFGMDLPLVKVDPAHGRALIENLLTLFRQLAGKRPVLLKTSSSGESGVLLEIETHAPGFRSEAALGAGCALSLASARRIVNAHGGLLEFYVDPEVGVRLEVMLP